MRIINKFAFSRILSDLEESIMKVEELNDYCTRLVLNTGEVVEYLLYTELKGVRAEKRQDSVLQWSKTRQEDIENQWLEDEINIVKDIYLMEFADEIEEYHAVCYQDIVVGILKKETINIEIKFCSYKPGTKEYAMEIYADGKEINSIFHLFKSEKEVLQWITSPIDIDISQQRIIY